MRPSRPLFAALAAATLACSSARNRGQQQCDCNADEVCFEDGCFGALVFAVRVDPNTPAYVVQDFNPVSVASNVVDLTLGDSGVLSGALKTMRSGESTDYSAKPLEPDTAVGILARGRSSSIPGLAFNDPASAVVREGGTFSLSVPPGFWTVIATPANPAMPPVTKSWWVAERSSSQESSKTLIIGFPGEPDLLKISGVLQRSAARPFAAGAGPLYRLQALDASGAALSQQITSRAGSEFVLWAQNAHPVILRATPDPAESAPLPSRDFVSDEKNQFGAFELGDSGEPVRVRGRVQDRSGKGIAYARVVLKGVARGGGAFGASARTGGTEGGAGADALGAFEVLLLPSDPASEGYTATARPPLGSPSATGSATLAVPAAQEILITCPDKVVLSGSVTTAAGDPALDVPILIESNPASAVPGPTVVAGLRTDGAGAFSARIEPGGYRVAAMPSLQSNLAWSSQRIQVDGPTSVALTLPETRQVSGTIKVRDRGTSSPLPNASVTFYRSDATSPIKLWEAITDSQGRFRVNLPKSGASNQ